MRKTISMLFWLLLLAAEAHAQLTTPFTFTNGTVANADEVNANFAKLADALNRTGGTMTGTLTSQQITPSAANTFDLGTAAAAFRTTYNRTSLVFVQTSGNYVFTWANPATSRAVSLEDPGGTDVFVWKAASQTLTNKTLTAPVLSGTVTGTYTLGGTPTITSPAISNPVFSGTATGTYTLGGTPTIPASGLTGTCCGSATNVALLAAQNAFTGNSNAILRQSYTNSTSDTTASAGWSAVAGTTTGVFDVFSQGYTNGTTDKTAGVQLVGTGTGGLSVAANNASGQLRFYAGGTASRFRILANGDWGMGSAGNVMDSIGTPSVTSGGGASAGVVGTDYAMDFHDGTTSSSNATITFGHTFTNGPICTATRQSTVDGTGITLQTTTTTVVVNYTAGLTDEHFFILCRGY